MATAASSFGQIYGARRYTQRIQPQVRPAPPNSTPAPAAPAQQQQVTPPPAAPAYQPVDRPVVTAKPADPVKAAAEKAKNDEKQFDFFRRRAEEGSDHAQYELGMRYLSGRGVAQDDKLGREWLAKAAKNGNTQASKKLAELGGEPEKIEPVPSSSDITAKAVDTKPAEQK